MTALKLQGRSEIWSSWPEEIMAEGHYHYRLADLNCYWVSRDWSDLSERRNKLEKCLEVGNIAMDMVIWGSGDWWVWGQINSWHAVKSIKIWSTIFEKWCVFARDFKKYWCHKDVLVIVCYPQDQLCACWCSGAHWHQSFSRHNVDKR